MQVNSITRLEPEFHLGDFIVTFINIIFVVLVILLIIWLVRTQLNRRKQLDRIEQKIDQLHSEIRQQRKD